MSVCDAWIGLGLLVLSVCTSSPTWAKGVAVYKATDEQKSQAEQRFKRGAELFGKSDYAAALEEFRASYDIVASPNPHLLVARTLAKQEKYDEAYAEYDKVIAEASALGGRYEEAGKSARTERDGIREKIALLSIRITRAKAGTKVSVGARVLEPGEWDNPVPVLAGSIAVKAHAPDGTTASKQVQAEPGGALDVQLTLPEKVVVTQRREGPPPDTRSEGVKLRRTIAYVSGGVGVAGLVTGTVFAVIDFDKYRDVAVGGFVVGAIGATAATILYLTSDGPPDANASTPGVAIGPGSIVVQGRF